MHIPFIPDPFGVIESSLLLEGTVGSSYNSYSSYEGIPDEQDFILFLNPISPKTSSTIPTPETSSTLFSHDDNEHVSCLIVVLVLVVGIMVGVVMRSCLSTLPCCVSGRQELVVVEGTTVPPLRASKVKEATKEGESETA